MSDRANGTVKWFNDEKGYGFIRVEGRDDVFVHFRGIERIKGQERKSLTAGQLVTFEIIMGPKGEQADHVRPV